MTGRYNQGVDMKVTDDDKYVLEHVAELLLTLTEGKCQNTTQCADCRLRIVCDTAVSLEGYVEQIKVDI